MKKKVLSILITILALCTCMFTLTACGENEPPHTHNYSTLKYDKESHWFECECKEKNNITVHNILNGQCVCGYVVPHVHDYTELKHNKTQHWNECVCGAYETKENHIPGSEATETTDQVCTECNYVITPALGHVHTLHLTKVESKSQSCTDEGNVEYYTCECGKWFTDSNTTTEITDKTSVVIGKDAHKYENLKQSETQHWNECSCGAFEIKENHILGVEATEDTDQICTECNYIIVPALGHVHTLHLTKVEAKPQSCTEEGNREYYTCSCEKWFTDNIATNEITDKTSVVIVKDDHNYIELKQSATQHWHECSCGDKTTPENHNPGASATETTDEKCTECGYVITPALGHIHASYLTKVEAKPQSCTKEGNIEYYICSCGKWFTTNTTTTEITNKDCVVIEKDEHNHTELINNEVEHWYECSCGDKSGIEGHKGGTATCIEKSTCSVCLIEYGELKTHNPKQQWETDDTYHWHKCETNGCSYQCNKTTHVLNSNKKCTICDYLSSQYLFTITWKNYDGTILEEDKNVLYGTVPTYDGEIPAREKDKQYTYVFSGWAPNIIGATENVTYTAQFNFTTNKYKVQFVDHDGSILEEQDVEYGQSATLPIDPYREGYRFIGWTGSYENIIEDVIIEANYVRQFTVQFVDYDNSIIDIQLVDIGENVIRPQDPVRNNYRFLDWDKAFNNVASDLTVKALYVRLYKVEFIDWDGTVLEEQIVEQAQSATSPKKNPNRMGYTFVSWNQDYTAVISNMQIVAVYEINRYIATFVMPDGAVIETKDNIAHGTTISSPKVEDMFFDWSKTKGYRFTGWKDWDESHPIESNITIIANYSQEITEPIIAIETREISKGTTTAEVSIYLCGSFESIYGISLKFEYVEQLVLSSGSIVVNSKLEGAEGTLKTDKNQYELSWVNGQGLNITERLEIVTLTFNIDKYTEIGEYAMSLFDGTCIIDGSYVKITPILVIGQVVVTE